MKSRLQLLAHLVRDYADQGVAFTVRDEQEISKRYASEGFAFLASVLPQLDEFLIEGLRSGCLPPLTGWKMKGHAPLLFHGAWRQIFDESGALLAQPSHLAVRAIRQVSRAFKKVFEVCDDSKVNLAVDAFVHTDGSVPTQGRWDDVKLVLSHVLDFGTRVDISSTEGLAPKHGPGATSERCNASSKWDFPAISPRIADRYGLDMFFPVYGDHEQATIEESSARLTAVPKTFDKPRLISIEPSATQFTQQGLLRRFESFLSRYPAVQNRDQERNRSLAYKGSLDGSLATLDLSEASDRLGWHFVQVTFPRPIVRALEATRSESITLLDGRTIQLKKFASMGSALTFPVQILAFFGLVAAAICRVEGNFDKAFVRSLLRNPHVGVYGDDIIVPVEYAESVRSSLEDAGLKVNTSKSFWSGLFRESCGGDYYAGSDVTPVYVRTSPPQNRRQVSEIVSWADLSIQLHGRGLYRAAKYASDIVLRHVPAAPMGTFVDSIRPSEAGLPAKPWEGAPRYDMTAALEVAYAPPVQQRYNKNLQAHEAFGLVVAPKRKKASATDHARLARSLFRVRGAARTLADYQRASTPVSLDLDERPTSLVLKRRWVRAW